MFSIFFLLLINNTNTHSWNGENKVGHPEVEQWARFRLREQRKKWIYHFNSTYTTILCSYPNDVGPTAVDHIKLNEIWEVRESAPRLIFSFIWRCLSIFHRIQFNSPVFFFSFRTAYAVWTTIQWFRVPTAPAHAYAFWLTKKMKGCICHLDSLRPVAVNSMRFFEIHATTWRVWNEVFMSKKPNGDSDSGLKPNCMSRKSD